jgi:hypothetical protein
MKQLCRFPRGISRQRGYLLQNSGCLLKKPGDKCMTGRLPAVAPDRLPKGGGLGLRRKPECQNTDLAERLRMA